MSEQLIHTKVEPPFLGYADVRVEGWGEAASALTARS
jgi:hypothetical protein